MIESLLNFSQATGIYYFMNSPWGWPIVESLHFLGLCLLIGTVGVFDLRLLGMAKGIEIADLHKLVLEARQIRGLLDTIARRYNARIVEQAAILGTLNQEVVDNPENALQAAEFLARRLDGLSPPEERGWLGEVTDDGGFRMSRTLRSVPESYVIDRPGSGG